MVWIAPSLEIYNELSLFQEALCLVLDFAAEFNMGQFIQAENVPGSLKAVSIFGSQLDAVLQITEARRADPLTSTSLTSRAEVYLRIRESHPKPGVVEVR